ncbi:unnamed protein product [Amoebophrya sp. A120]|nr:unnamed protein product [Amoebophrya sp. A120]|eukprot:GSA120T00023640001.1
MWILRLSQEFDFDVAGENITYDDYSRTGTSSSSTSGNRHSSGSSSSSSSYGDNSTTTDGSSSTNKLLPSPDERWLRRNSSETSSASKSLQAASVPLMTTKRTHEVQVPEHWLGNLIGGNQNNSGCAGRATAVSDHAAPRLGPEQHPTGEILDAPPIPTTTRKRTIAASVFYGTDSQKHGNKPVVERGVEPVCYYVTVYNQERVCEINFPQNSPSKNVINCDTCLRFLQFLALTDSAVVSVTGDDDRATSSSSSKKLFYHNEVEEDHQHLHDDPASAPTTASDADSPLNQEEDLLAGDTLAAAQNQMQINPALLSPTSFALGSARTCSTSASTVEKAYMCSSSDRRAEQSGSCAGGPDTSPELLSRTSSKSRVLVPHSARSFRAADALAQVFHDEVGGASSTPENDGYNFSQTSTLTDSQRRLRQFDKSLLHGKSDDLMNWHCLKCDSRQFFTSKFNEKDSRRRNPGGATAGITGSSAAFACSGGAVVLRDEALVQLILGAEIFGYAEILTDFVDRLASELETQTILTVAQTVFLGCYLKKAALRQESYWLLRHYITHGAPGLYIGTQTPSSTATSSSAAPSSTATSTAGTLAGKLLSTFGADTTAATGSVVSNNEFDYNAPNHHHHQQDPSILALSKTRKTYNANNGVCNVFYDGGFLKFSEINIEISKIWNDFEKLEKKEKLQHAQPAPGFSLCKIRVLRDGKDIYPQVYQLLRDHDDELLLQAIKESDNGAIRIYSCSKKWTSSKTTSSATRPSSSSAATAQPAMPSKSGGQNFGTRSLDEDEDDLSSWAADLSSSSSTAAPAAANLERCSAGGGDEAAAATATISGTNRTSVDHEESCGMRTEMEGWSVRDFARHFVGEVRVNFWGTKFELIDYTYASPAGSAPAPNGMPPSGRRFDLGFEVNLQGCVPRKITCKFHHAPVKEVEEGEESASASSSGFFFSSNPAPRPSAPRTTSNPQESTSRSTETYTNIEPRWNEKQGSYVLPFYGRVKKSSAKNFQLVEGSNEKEILLLFGKIKREWFALDFRHPLSPLDAFGIAIASLAKKRAVN